MLEAAATQVEQGFLSTGRGLERAVDILDRLSRRFGDYTAELTGDALKDTSAELINASLRIEQLVDVRHTDSASFDLLADIISAIRHRIAALEPVTGEVETLSLSARVVAGSMGTAAADFAIFAQDVREAAQHARDCLSEAHDALCDVQQELTAARTEVDAFTRRNSGAIQAIPSRLDDNLRGLKTQQQLAADAAAAAQSQSEAVRQQVAEQIVALQLGDIVRQRIEHVQTAMQSLLEPHRQAGPLLAAQLNDAADDLIRQGARVEAGLWQLASAARAIGHLGVQLHGKTETQSGGFVAELECDIRRTAELFAAISTDDATTDRRMAAFLGAADTLAARLAKVQSVQEDIRLMGLNATFKCSRLGAIGRPLATVAQELRTCSVRFGAGAASILDDLERLRPIAARLRDPARSAQHAALARAADDMLVPLRRLHGLEQELAEALLALQSDADEVGQLVEDAVSRFAIHHDLATTLRDVAGDLAVWEVDAAAEQGASEVLDRIADHYTMDRERVVHSRFAQLPPVQAAAALDDVLF